MSWKITSDFWSRNTSVSSKQRPHYQAEIWKRFFFPTLRPTVHTNPSRKRSFSKTLFGLEEFEKPRLVIFVWTENILKTELFENNDATIIMWFPLLSFPQTQIQANCPVIVALLNSSGVVWGHIWYVFTVKSTFPNSSRVVCTGPGFSFKNSRAPSLSGSLKHYVALELSLNKMYIQQRRN